MKGSDFLRKSDYLIAGILFTMSAVLTLLLFFQSAGHEIIYKVVFSILAISFDATKVVLWIRGTREKNRVFIALAVALVGISLLASSGSSLMIVSEDDHKVATNEREIVDARTALESARKEVASWQERLDRVPNEFTTQLQVVANQLATARKMVETAQSQVTHLEQAASQVSTSATTMFSLIGSVLHWEPSRIKLLFLLAVAFLLETSALATSYHAGPKKSILELVQDSVGTAHITIRGKALCGKPAPFTKVNRQAKPCLLCMERSVNNASNRD